MSYYAINGLMGFFDLRNFRIDSELGIEEEVFYESLPCGIKLIVLNNFCYYFDFFEANFIDIKPHLIHMAGEVNPSEIRNSISIYLQKEMINAFNACMHLQFYKNDKNKFKLSDRIKRLDMINGIDQFFIPNNIDRKILPLDNYLYDSDFSNQVYKIACEIKHKEEPNTHILTRDMLKEGIKMFKDILGDLENANPYHTKWFYLLAQIWKAVYYRNHDLRIDSIILARSIFEALVKRDRNKWDKNLGQQDYEEYLKDKSKNELYSDVKILRDNSAHTLVVPNIVSKLDYFLRELTYLFKRDSKIDIEAVLR